MIKACRYVARFNASLTMLLIASIFVTITTPLIAGDWLQFRGTDNNSVAVEAGDLPTTFDADTNIAWVADLPGRGPSSPIVVNGRVVVTCSGGRQQDRLYVIAIDTRTGELLWQREFWATGRTLCNPTTANAAPTPASDGKHIYAFYSSNDLICLDLDGNLQWYRGLGFDYPKAGNDIGMSSSPVVIGETVVVQIESQGDSFAAGIDAMTGVNRWRLRRDKSANWASPVAVKPPNGQATLLLQSGSGITAHDPYTGAELWRYETSCDRITSPASHGNVVFLPSKGLSAITIPAVGQQPELLWDDNRLSPGASSPVVHEGRVYTVNRAGVLNCAKIADGSIIWKERLGIGRQWATPAIAGNYLYCFDSDGKAAVVQLGDKPSVVSKSELGEPIQASPALVDGAIYIRSDKHLWKIAKK